MTNFQTLEKHVVTIYSKGKLLFVSPFEFKAKINAQIVFQNQTQNIITVFFFDKNLSPSENDHFILNPKEERWITIGNILPDVYYYIVYQKKIINGNELTEKASMPRIIIYPTPR